MAIPYWVDEGGMTYDEQGRLLDSLGNVAFGSWHRENTGPAPVQWAPPARIDPYTMRQDLWPQQQYYAWRPQPPDLSWMQAGPQEYRAWR